MITRQEHEARHRFADRYRGVRQGYGRSRIRAIVGRMTAVGDRVGDGDVAWITDRDGPDVASVGRYRNRCEWRLCAEHGSTCLSYRDTTLRTTSEPRPNVPTLACNGPAMLSHHQC
jgi:hypothetical protein